MAGSGIGWSGLLNRLRSGRQLDQSAEIRLDNDAIKKLSDFYGIKLTSDGRGNVTVLPSDADSFAHSTFSRLFNRGDSSSASDISGFIDYWFRASYITPNEDSYLEQDRKARYSHYSFMDSNSSEAILTLDTYADELVAVGALEENPIKIKIDDKKVRDQVMDILIKNNILSSSEHPTYERAEIRELGKFGDRFYKISKLSKDADIRIHKVRCPELVRVIYDPRSYATLMYAAGQNGEDVYYPWEFSYSKIPDSKTSPYGRSILEAMRTAYQQLIINEALLAISRASKVDRLVVRVPVPSKNAASAFANLLSMRRSLKSAIFGDSGSASSRAKLDAFTDIALMPSGPDYGLEKMSSGINVSDIEDVEYWRNKYIMASRLPKGYLLADDSYKIDAGTLQAQDLKFSRALLPLQYGYVEGLTRMITSIIIILGYDVTKIKVSVQVKKPQAFNQQVLKDATQSLLFIDTLMKTYEAAIAGPNTKFDKDRAKVLKIFSDVSGLPSKFLKLLDQSIKPIDAPPDDTSTSVLDPPVTTTNNVSDLLSDNYVSCTSDEILRDMMFDSSKFDGLLTEARVRSGSHDSLVTDKINYVNTENQYIESLNSKYSSSSKSL